MNTRRDFIKNILLVGPAALFLTRCTKQEQSSSNTMQTPSPSPSPSSETETAMLEEEDPTAKALKYVKDAQNADPKYKIAKMGIKPEEQFCDNCQFYKPVAGRNAGTCQVLTKGLVTEKGWCMSWAKKAAT